MRAKRTALFMIVALVATLIPVGPSPIALAAGCDTPGTPTTTVYLPNITKTLGGPDGWVTPFIVQNVGTVAATLEVSFYRFSDGSLVTCRKVIGLAPGTSFADVPNNDTDLPADSQFAVVVRSFGAQVVSVVNEHQGVGDRSEALSYVGLVAGATKVALPYVAKAVGGWITTVVVQNLGAATATVTASFVNDDGTRTATLTRTIGPGRSQFIDPTVEPMLLAGTEYAVSISSTQPIAVVANAHNDAATAARPKGFSYNGIADTTGDAFLAWAGRNADGTGRSTSILVQNTGSADATPTLTFRRIGGTEQAIVTAPAPLRPGRRWVYLLPNVATAVCPAVGTPTCPRDGEHSVVVTGGDFAVLGYSLDVATAMAVTAGPPSPSRIYLPNVTRTLGGPSGWTTPIVLQSAGATSATLRWHRFTDGALAVTQYIPGLTSGGSVRVDPRTVAGLTDDTQYAVVADASGAARAIVLELSQSGGDGAMAYEGFAATGTLSAAPVLTSLSLAPTSASVALGRPQQFTATVKDQSGNAITGGPITWSVSPAALGTVDPSGLFTAGSATGSGTLIAAFGSLSATASLATFSPTVTIGGITFNVRTTASSDVYTESTIATADVETIVAVIDPSVAYVEGEFGRKLAQRPAIYAFRDTASMTAGWSSVLGATTTPPIVNGAFVPATKRLGLNWGGMKGQLPYSTVRHELVHMMENQITKQDLSMPLWFIEGIARLNDLTEPGGQWRIMQGRHQVASMAATGTLFAMRISDTEFRTLSTGAINAAYFESAETVRLIRNDMTPAGLNRFLEDIGGGRTFRDAFMTATGLSLETFLAGRDQRLRALAPAYPGIATANDTVQGGGLTYMVYGFTPGSSVTRTITVPGFLPSVTTVQVDTYGTLISYLGSGWPPGSYTITAVGGGQTATTTTMKVATTEELSIGLAADIGELPRDTPALPTTLPE